ncbi:hypothetical protein NKH18_38085 [Streptomyces sp. M10(2022)]
MFRTIVKTIAVIAVCCTVGGTGLVVYEEFIKDDSTSVGASWVTRSPGPRRSVSAAVR